MWRDIIRDAFLQILPLVNGSALIQSELLANFSLTPAGGDDAGGFSLGAVLGMNNNTEVTIYLNGSYSGSRITKVSCSDPPLNQSLCCNILHHSSVVKSPDLPRR